MRSQLMATKMPIFKDSSEMRNCGGRKTNEVNKLSEGRKKTGLFYSMLYIPEIFSRKQEIPKCKFNLFTSFCVIIGENRVATDVIVSMVTRAA